jgi:hypothetical protein
MHAKKLFLAVSTTLLALLTLVIPYTQAAQVQLQWDAPTTNTDGTPLTDLAGYELHFGQTSGNYASTVNVGNTTSFSLTSGLVEGQTYYFAVKAYDSSGNKSGFSNEVNVTIPETVVQPPPAEEPPPSSGDSSDGSNDGSTGGSNGGQTSALVAAHFDTNADGFQYVDDTFRGTKQPTYANGTYRTSGGFSGGTLEVILGKIDGADILGMSGGWKRTFTLSAATEVTLALRYNLSVSAGVDSDEFGEIVASVNGQLLGANGNDYVTRLHGASTGTTGWQVFEKSLGVLAAGEHTVIVGGYMNKKTSVHEWATVLIDDVQITAAVQAPDSGDSGSGSTDTGSGNGGSDTGNNTGDTGSDTGNSGSDSGTDTGSGNGGSDTGNNTGDTGSDTGNSGSDSGTDTGSDPVLLPVVAVTASATQDPNVPANTLDGNLETRWSASGQGQWIQYDLGATKTVSHVAIAWYRGDQRTSVFDIEVSLDGLVWTTVHNGTSSGLSVDLETYDFDNVTARFVRIVGFGNSANTWNSITELEIHGTDGVNGGTDTGSGSSDGDTGSDTGNGSSDSGTDTGFDPVVLPIAAVTASAAQDPNVPANTLDGSLETRWSASGQGQWIQYDLGAIKTVSHVAIAWYRGDQRTSVFDIEVSLDGLVWTTVHNGTSSGLSVDLETYDFDDVTARFVRIVGFGNSANTWNSITELVISGQ